MNNLVQQDKSAVIFSPGFGASVNGVTGETIRGYTKELGLECIGIPLPGGRENQELHFSLRTVSDGIMKKVESLVEKGGKVMIIGNSMTSPSVIEAISKLEENNDKLRIELVLLSPVLDVNGTIAKILGPDDFGYRQIENLGTNMGVTVRGLELISEINGDFSYEYTLRRLETLRAKVDILYNPNDGVIVPNALEDIFPKDFGGKYLLYKTKSPVGDRTNHSLELPKSKLKSLMGRFCEGSA